MNIWKRNNGWRNSDDSLIVVGSAWMDGWQKDEWWDQIDKWEKGRVRRWIDRLQKETRDGLQKMEDGVGCLTDVTELQTHACEDTHIRTWEIGTTDTPKQRALTPLRADVKEIVICLKKKSTSVDPYFLQYNCRSRTQQYLPTPAHSKHQNSNFYSWAFSQLAPNNESPNETFLEEEASPTTSAATSYWLPYYFHVG